MKTFCLSPMRVVKQVSFVLMSSLKPSLLGITSWNFQSQEDKASHKLITFMNKPNLFFTESFHSAVNFPIQ